MTTSPDTLETIDTDALAALYRHDAEAQRDWTAHYRFAYTWRETNRATQLAWMRGETS